MLVRILYNWYTVHTNILTCNILCTLYLSCKPGPRRQCAVKNISLLDLEHLTQRAHFSSKLASHGHIDAPIASPRICDQLRRASCCSASIECPGGGNIKESNQKYLYRSFGKRICFMFHREHLPCARARDT